MRRAPVISKTQKSSIDDDVIARGEEMSVLSMHMRVMAIEDVLVTKLMASARSSSSWKD